MKRRTALTGLGALAFGSGAAFTSAAFENNVRSDADMRVIVDQELTVEAGNAFDSSGTVAVSDDASGDQSDKLIDPRDSTDGDGTGSGFFDGSDELGTVFDDEDPPLATVTARNDGQNEDIRIFNAMDYPDSATFGDASGDEGFLHVRNDTDESVLVGIGYDSDEDQYGDNVNTDLFADLSDSELWFNHVQNIYQFKVSKDDTVLNEEGDDTTSVLISPNGDDFEGEDAIPESGEEVDRAADRPDNVVRIVGRETVQIELEINTDETDPLGSRDKKVIDAADTELGFDEGLDLVDLLDHITVASIDKDDFDSSS